MKLYFSIKKQHDMTKKEIIWRHILNEAIEKGINPIKCEAIVAKQKVFNPVKYLQSKFNRVNKFQQKDLAKFLGFSLCTVFNALKIPRELGAIEVTGRGFRVRDVEKFLYIWATCRNINKEIIYKTHSLKSVREIEGEMPANIVYGAYSAYIKKYKDAPADYDKVYVYASEKELTEIKKRFPQKKGYENLFALKKDFLLDKFGSVTPDVQTFVDLWNLSDWYAKEFLNELKGRLFK